MDHRENNLGFFNTAAAKKYSDRVAVIDMSKTPPTELTHARLDDRMSRVGSALQKAGLQPHTRVLLAMENRAEFIEAFFGAMRAGCVPIPLNHKLGADTIRFIIADAGAGAAIIDPMCHPEIAQIVEEASLSLRVATAPVPTGWLDYALWRSESDASELRAPKIERGQTAFLPYTSGSTGVPKGVLLPHDGMLWGIRVAQKYWPAEPNDRALIAGPLFHKNAMRVSVKPKLRVGGSVVILPRFEPKAFLTALAEYHCTHTGGVPAMYRMVLAEEELLSRLEFPALKSLEMGSAVVGADLIAAVESAFSVPVIEAYGLTEGGGPLREPMDGGGSPLGSCGLVAPEVDVKLVGAEGKEDEREGELWVRSPAVLSGYNNRPELDAERLVDGYLKTRDIFRRDENGFFYFMGRTDDQFSCGGENINPKEVELLLVQHPEIVDAVVVPVPHIVKGFAPAALVTLRRDAEVDESALKKFTLANGPAYAHPRRIFSVDELPLNGAGKIDRTQALSEVTERIGGDGSIGSD